MTGEESLTDLCPHPDDALMASAWFSCLSWAIETDHIRADFESDSGLKWASPKTPLDRMVDEATGFKFDQLAYIGKFIIWFNENVWGEVPSDDEENDE